MCFFGLLPKTSKRWVCQRQFGFLFQPNISYQILIYFPIEDIRIYDYLHLSIYNKTQMQKGIYLWLALNNRALATLISWTWTHTMNFGKPQQSRSRSIKAFIWECVPIWWKIFVSYSDSCQWFLACVHSRQQWQDNYYLCGRRQQPGKTPAGKLGSDNVFLQTLIERRDPGQ